MISSLFQMYERDRLYHDWSHVSFMLSNLSRYFPSENKHYPLQYAILYHDAVYEAGEWDNEFRSAILLEKHYEDNPNAFQLIDYDALREAQRLIMLTKDHVTREGDYYGSIMIDLDLGGLAAEPDVYQANSVNIRAEFKKFDDEQWRAGRIAWLTTFLARDHIYYTQHGRENWEARARANMQAELDYLNGIR